MVDGERFYAWLDGELAIEEAALVEAAVAADPELSRLAKEHRAMTTGLRSAFAQVETIPVPARLIAAIEQDGKVANLAEVRNKSATRSVPAFWVQAAALAATLAIGIFAGNMLSGSDFGRSADPIKAENGRLIASAGLEVALNTQLASAPVDGPTRIGLTFREKAGAICRTFEEPASRGIACREHGDWRIRSLLQGSEGQVEEYRMAGTNSQLMEAVLASIDGEPFDAAEEKAAMESGWTNYRMRQGP